jgi:hypothetical protein
VITQTSNLADTIQALEALVQDCKDVVLDWRFLKFQSSPDEQSLTDTATDTKYLFKKCDDPSDAVGTHAVRQLCKMVGVPYSFFQDNRPSVRESFVGNWITSMAPKEDLEKLVLLKVREGQGLNVIRAILPVETVTIPYHTILKNLSAYPVDITVDLDSATGILRDDLVMHARLVYEDTLSDPQYFPGVAITVSDLGGSDIIIDLYLMHRQSKACFVALYGGKPFARVQIARVQPAEITEILSSIPARLKDEAETFLKSLEETEASYPGVERSCVIVSSKKDVPKKFKRAIHLEATSCFEDMATLKDFIRHAGLVAMSFDYSDRLKIERAAGSFGGLAYRKS